MSARKLVTIITPVYNEELTVRDCHACIKAMFATELAAYDYEHLFSDNNSGDSTLEILRELAKVDPHVKVISNARNYGYFKSTYNALMNASGDAIVVMFPADLQDPPELIPQFVAKWAEGIKIVYGIRAKREEPFWLRSSRRIFYYIVNRFSDINIPMNVGEFMLIDKQVKDELTLVDDYYPYIRGLIFSLGHSCHGIPFTWKRREKGISKHRIFTLVDQALNGIISFSNIPMRLITFAGLGLSALCFIYSIAMLVATLLRSGELTAGIPTLLVAIFFLAGVQLFTLGMIGEYVSAIHFQVRKRPFVTEKERINLAADANKTRA